MVAYRIIRHGKTFSVWHLLWDISFGEPSPYNNIKNYIIVDTRIVYPP